MIWADEWWVKPAGWKPIPHVLGSYHTNKFTGDSKHMVCTQCGSVQHLTVEDPINQPYRGEATWKEIA